MKGGWREREQERALKRKEQERIDKENERIKQFEKNDDNFPSLGSAAPIKAVSTGVDFAKKAREWKEMDERAKVEAENRRLQQEKEEAERRPLFVFRRKLHHSFEDEYYDERMPVRPNSPVQDGWSEVSGRAQRPKRPISEEEYMRRLEEKYSDNMQEVHDEAEEFNPNQSYGTRDFY
jgi:hypothetical protein